MGFTKLFSDILDSSIWRETKETRLVWITMLAMSDRDGHVSAAVPGLADRAKVTLEECIAALEVLSSPDKWSRSAEHEGRRIKAVDGGWLVLNHAKYRAKMSAEERRTYKAAKQAQYRSRKSKPSPGENAAVKLAENGHTEAAEAIAAEPSERIEQARAELPPALE